MLLNITKKLISLILSVQILCSAFLLFPTTTNAAIDSYNFKIPIPNFSSVRFDGTTRPLAEYIQAIYKYAIGIVAILATVVMMIGGVVWITAAGDSGRIGEAKQYITGALTGLVLALCSFMILQTVDPDLVRFKAIGITPVTPMEVKNVSPLKDNGAACCKTDPDCGQGYVCVTSMTTAQCTYGVCAQTSGLPYNSVCDISKGNQCQSNLVCSQIDGTSAGRCMYVNPGENKPCNNGNCDNGLYCYGKEVLSSNGICYDGSFNDPCTAMSQCDSEKCINIKCYNDCKKNKTDCYNDCKQDNYFTTCSNIEKDCGCL